MASVKLDSFNEHPVKHYVGHTVEKPSQPVFYDELNEILLSP